MQLGPWDVQLVSAGTFRLDGGAMYGTVPKAVWQKVHPADEDNQILMDTQCLLLRREVAGQRQVVLVENGNGDKETDDFMARFKLAGRGILLANLARLGVQPEDVTHCILTHLHFDHAGGSTRLDAEGRAVPTFPNAQYFIQAQDLADARKPHLRVKASYLSPNWEPLVAAGQLVTVEGETEILPGITVRPAPGHIQGLQIVVVEGGGRKLYFVSDLIPTSRHVQPAWCMGYDLDVVTCVNERLKVLDEVVGTDTICAFYHDPDTPAGTLSRDPKGRILVTPVAV